MSALDSITVDPELTCSECDDPVERGYLPVDRTDGEYEPRADLAVCDACGWRDVGHMGCAPELRDFDAGDLLVRVEAGDEGLAPAEVTDERE